MACMMLVHAWPLAADATCILQVREGVQQLSDSLCAAVERLASDLYESECHFLYEIIQNLDFACACAPSMLR